MARKHKHQTPATGSLAVDMTRPQTFGGVRQAVGTGHLTVSPRVTEIPQVAQKKPRRKQTKPPAPNAGGGEVIALPVLTFQQVSEGGQPIDTGIFTDDLHDEDSGTVSYFDFQ